MSSRKAGQQRHAIARARERYGLLLGFRELGETARRISQGRARHIRGDVWELDYWRKTVRVVYSPETDAIVTFLPPPD